MADKWMTISGKYQHHTDKAVCIYLEELGEDTWLPFSQCCDDADSRCLIVKRGDPIELEISHWIARKKGLLPE